VRVAVLSDVHGNLHALAAVLAALASESPDQVWCLGDLVGYGPRPNECCSLVRDRADLCLIGNHDLAVLGRLDLEDFQPDAAAAASWTKDVLEPGLRSYLESLSPTAEREGVGLYHASPRDPVWEYVLSPGGAWAALAAAPERLVLVGHSHVALRFTPDGDLDLAPEGTELDLRQGRWILNPGSVGQPRDGDARAAWILLDLEGERVSFRRVLYEVERTQDEIRKAGLPEALATRLAHGV
jgi:diadenosine tetraphosphatase ApaH/serine/threonine PP2A family protein phosphatase